MGDILSLSVCLGSISAKTAVWIWLNFCTETKVYPGHCLTFGSDRPTTGWPLSRQCEIPRHFPHGLLHSSEALGMLSVTHIMPVLVLNTCMDANKQLAINSFRSFSPDTSLTLGKIRDTSLTADKIPDISRFTGFSTQVVTLWGVPQGQPKLFMTQILCQPCTEHI